MRFENGSARCTSVSSVAVESSRFLLVLPTYLVVSISKICRMIPMLFSWQSSKCNKQHANIGQAAQLLTSNFSGWWTRRWGSFAASSKSCPGSTHSVVNKPGYSTIEDGIYVRCFSETSWIPWVMTITLAGFWWMNGNILRVLLLLLATMNFPIHICLCVCGSFTSPHGVGCLPTGLELFWKNTIMVSLTSWTVPLGFKQWWGAPGF